MTRYGMALINGELTCSADVSQGARWLIRGSQEATSKYPAGLYEYAILHENGIQPVIFKDHLFMLSLLQQGCKLGDPRSHVKCAQGYDQGLWGLIYSPRDAYSHYLRAAKKNNPEVQISKTRQCTEPPFIYQDLHPRSYLPIHHLHLNMHQRQLCVAIGMLWHYLESSITRAMVLPLTNQRQ